MQIHNDTIIKTQEDFFNKYVPLILFVTFACERELETEHNCNILTPTLMAVNFVSFSFSRAAQPEVQRPTLLGDGFLYCILSATYLQLSDFLSWPSYIILQRPLNRLLDLWNGMFDRHQAEITVM